MSSLLKAELKKMVKAIKEEDKKVYIKGYVKPTNRYRTKEGKADITINTNLPPYDELLQQSLNKLNNVSRQKLKQVAKKYNVDIDVVEEQLEKVKDSLRRRISNFDDTDNTPSDDYIRFGAGIKMKKDSNAIYFTGKKVEEHTIIQEEYKDKNSRTTTLIKDEFRNDLPIKMKTYKVESSNYYKISLV